MWHVGVLEYVYNFAGAITLHRGSWRCRASMLRPANSSTLLQVMVRLAAGVRSFGDIFDFASFFLEYPFGSAGELLANCSSAKLNWLPVLDIAR